MLCNSYDCCCDVRWRSSMTDNRQLEWPLWIEGKPMTHCIGLSLPLHCKPMTPRTLIGSLKSMHHAALDFWRTWWYVTKATIRGWLFPNVTNGFMDGSYTEHTRPGYGGKLHPPWVDTYRILALMTLLCWSTVKQPVNQSYTWNTIILLGEVQQNSVFIFDWYRKRKWL